MRAIEALERLIKLGDYALGLHPSQRPENEEGQEFESNKAAVAICQAMVNTAIPIARYRAHVEVEQVWDKGAKIGVSDFSICSQNMAGIQAGIAALGRDNLTVRVTLWNQRADGADMLSGYQGQSKSQNFRIWYRDIVSLEQLPTIQ